MTNLCQVCNVFHFVSLEMLTTCRNALSILGLLVKAIYSAVIASTFSTWTAAGVWGGHVVSEVISTSHNWDREENLVMEFVLGDTTHLL